MRSLLAIAFTLTTLSAAVGQEVATVAASGDLIDSFVTSLLPVPLPNDGDDPEFEIVAVKFCGAENLSTGRFIGLAQKVGAVGRLTRGSISDCDAPLEALAAAACEYTGEVAVAISSTLSWQDWSARLALLEGIGTAPSANGKCEATETALASGTLLEFATGPFDAEAMNGAVIRYGIGMLFTDNWVTIVASPGLILADIGGATATGAGFTDAKSPLTNAIIRLPISTLNSLASDVLNVAPIEFEIGEVPALDLPETGQIEHMALSAPAAGQLRLEVTASDGSDLRYEGAMLLAGSDLKVSSLSIDYAERACDMADPLKVLACRAEDVLRTAAGEALAGYLSGTLAGVIFRPIGSKYVTDEEIGGVPLLFSATLQNVGVDEREIRADGHIFIERAE